MSDRRGVHLAWCCRERLAAVEGTSKPDGIIYLQIAVGPGDIHLAAWADVNMAPEREYVGERREDLFVNEGDPAIGGTREKDFRTRREAEEIVDHARRETERMGGRAGADLEKAVERRERLAMERIAQAEAKAIAEVRGEAVDIALEATRRLLAEQLTGKKADTLVDNAIKELPDKLH